MKTKVKILTPLRREYKLRVTGEVLEHIKSSVLAGQSIDVSTDDGGLYIPELIVAQSVFEFIMDGDDEKPFVDAASRVP